MFSDVVNDSRRALPQGYVAIAASETQCEAPLRLCVLVRRQAEPVAGQLVVLRDTMDARVLLGCLLDAGGQVHQWLELWVQDLAGLTSTAIVCREALSNDVLDRRWAQRFASFVETDGAGVIHTGWETNHPAPTFLDVSAGRPIHPVEAESGLPWALCRDDALLSAKGLPPYSSSLHRYLHLAELGSESPFVPLREDAPRNESCRDMELPTTGDEELIPFNAGGGLMLVRTHGPIGLEAFCELLGGAEWTGLLHGRSPVQLDASTAALDKAATTTAAEGRLFLGPHGRAGRFVETFHLKLRMFADAVTQVRHAVAQQDRPVLDLTADSFQVRLGPLGQALPFLWTAHSALANTGDAIHLPIEGSDVQYYLRAGAAAMSIYYPASASPVQGRGTVRIRQFLTDARDRTVLEGTFATQERLDVTPNDLVWTRLNVASQRVDLYARLEKAAAMAAGEWRFRTISQAFSPEVLAALKQAEGVPIPNALFDVVPLLSSPCDLYALGVLGVRLLLVDEQTSLPIALDETFSLARQAAAEYDESVPLGERISRLFEQDKRWPASLGPGRLTREEIPPQEAFDLIPAELWYDTLGLLIGLFPGIGPDSQCADFGDAPAGGLHRIFDPVIEGLDTLLLRTRSLIVIDWRFNRQVHSAIRKHLVGLAGTSAPETPGR